MPPEPQSGAENSPERIRSLAHALNEDINGAYAEIEEINVQTKILAMNARIEAARAGMHGAAFAVVGEEMVLLAERTQRVATELNEKTRSQVQALAEISAALSTKVRGVRLSDLALANIDVIDRNLYERSCDCRWWATDAAFVSALTEPTEDNLRYASQRMSIILRSYTVYFDIVLADLTGRILTNGHPETFACAGRNHEKDDWFKSALATKSGDEFGFQGAHPCRLVNGQRALIYSCTVRRDGKPSGETIGVLGIVFRWDALAETVLKNTPIGEEERKRTRLLIADQNGLIIADSAGQALSETFDPAERAKIFAEKKGYHEAEYKGAASLIAHALAPGFETYTCGWHAVIVQGNG